ncbi:MAG TPA: beta-ketoacyl synthase chain length factor [Casimicrobiaceae bacterium]|nr:beta-ketoacyl synthase chain length factor [Casimicrobiaceae bacterium]
MNIAITGGALCGPGVPDWASAIALLRGEAQYEATQVREPSPVALPANERRRLPGTARVALGIGIEALEAAQLDVGDVATVFASCGSDGQITHQICEALARPIPEMSPTRFHNSVHNAAAGYWSIALGSRAPSTSLCAHAGSFAAGLLEAATQATFESRTVLLIAYDLPYPAPLSSLWSVEGTFAAAFVIAPLANADAPLLNITLTSEPVSEWPRGFPVALATHPAAAALQIVALLAAKCVSRAVIPYHSGCNVAVSIG